MKRARIIAAAAAVALGAAGLGLGTPATGATFATTVFTAGATVGDPTFAPGLGPEVETTFNFSTVNVGIGSQRVCIAAHSANGVDAQCALAASGTYGAGLGGVGGYCGYSSGRGQVTTADINGNTLPAAGLYLQWPQSAGTLLPQVYRLGNATSGTVVGVGAVQTTGAQPGTCGFNGGTESFAVTGFSVLALP